MNNYSIQSYGNLIVVDLKGQWSVQDDLVYISSLGEEIAKQKNHPWAILVDMRGWQGQPPAAQASFKISLDRRNQKAEYWIVDHPAQADYLLPYFNHTSVRPQKFIELNQAKIVIAQAGHNLTQVPLFVTPDN
ncbi:hypothetical protein [Paraglaciecola aestuariivivens]